VVWAAWAAECTKWKQDEDSFHEELKRESRQRNYLCRLFLYHPAGFVQQLYFSSHREILRSFGFES
jgi:hypothetical protein